MSDSAPFDFEAFARDLSAKNAGKAIEFVMPSTGETFHIPPPMDWDDEIVELQAEAGANPRAANAAKLARAYLECGGEGQWERFKAAGGKAIVFMKFLDEKLAASTGE